MPKLIHNIQKICEHHENVHIPYRLGCGLAGGNWDELVEAIKNLPVTVVRCDRIPVIDMGIPKKETEPEY